MWRGRISLPDVANCAKLRKYVPCRLCVVSVNTVYGRRSCCARTSQYLYLADKRDRVKLRDVYRNVSASRLCRGVSRVRPTRPPPTNNIHTVTAA